jgi:O-antigen biosynthesis protein
VGKDSRFADTLEMQHQPSTRISQLYHPPLRPRAAGKFLWLGDEKFFVRGVTYGAFPPNAEGHQFPEPTKVAQDFALMNAAGINSLLTYTVPPRSLLDQAQERQLRVIINVPWMGHTCFLEQAATRRAARLAVKDAVAACRDHAAVLMYAIAKELPPQIVRWYGKKKIENFLHDLYKVAKDEDPTGLVTYTNFPTTEYLELPFVDVHTFNVYLHQRRDFCSYLSRLQHIAGERPLVLTELGMCSFRHGLQGQAEFLDWQMEESFDHGLAGCVVFSWTDPFFQDGCVIDEWGFGLVDADRQPKPSFEVIRRRFTQTMPFTSARRWPRISVVVAFYNSEKTLDACLGSLAKLDYPDYEVIVVNDGSTDQSQEIVERYPFKSIVTENQGVSAARNLGLHAATGEIVAYIDSDAYADPHWLRYLAATFQESDFAGVGGPNLVPPTDNWVAKCVYRSPGGPTQVMLDDSRAEHIPGCNMAFSKAALDEIGGFDPIFTAAGDDVDVCWRLLARNYRLGFSPSAVVWHHRRSTLGAYWRQQVGYGKAECLLERRHPNKFNPWGHTFWGGTIYSPYPRFRLFGRPVIYHGTWGAAPFQSLYETGQGAALSFLPRAMETHLTLAALMALSLVFPWALAVVAMLIGYIFFYSAACAVNANLDVLGPEHASWTERLKWRLVIGWLHFLEPFARDWGRLQGGLTPWRCAFGAQPSHLGRPWKSFWCRLQPFWRRVKWSYSGDAYLEKDAVLKKLTQSLAAQTCAVGWNSDFEAWDLKLRRGALGEARLRMVVEHHGGPRRVARFSAYLRASLPILWTLAVLAIGSLVAAILGLFLSCAALMMLFLLLWIASVREVNRVEDGLWGAAQHVCAKLVPTHPN